MRKSPIKVTLIPTENWDLFLRNQELQFLSACTLIRKPEQRCVKKMLKGNW